MELSDSDLDLPQLYNMLIILSHVSFRFIVMYNLVNLHNQIVIISTPHSNLKQHLVVNKYSKIFPGNVVTLQMKFNVCEC